MLDAVDPAALAGADRADVDWAYTERLRFNAERRPAQHRERRILHEYLDRMRRVTIGDVRVLMRYGVPIEGIAAVVPAPARIARNRTGELYWPANDGQAAWVFPVRCVDPGDPAAIETRDPLDVVSTTGPVVDVIAFNPKNKGRWVLRLGLATVLGAIEPQYLDPPAVPVHRDVTDWLRAQCRGIVLLTHDPIEAERILRQCAKISAENEAHEAELRRVMTMPAPVWPEITDARLGAAQHERLG